MNYPICISDPRSSTFMHSKYYPAADIFPGPPGQMANQSTRFREFVGQAGQTRM